MDARIPEQPDLRPNMARLGVPGRAHPGPVRGLAEEGQERRRQAPGSPPGSTPTIPGWLSLIGELAMNSPEFATMWAEHGVRKWALATYRMHHPVVGRMELNLQSLPVPQEDGQRIVVATAGADTASAAALHPARPVRHPGSGPGGHPWIPSASVDIEVARVVEFETVTRPPAVMFPDIGPRVRRTGSSCSVRGRLRAGVRTFASIPYAAPVTGPARFAPCHRRHRRATGA
ncbi:hypothetical protein ACRAWF_00365 [Streptomyces sp. L7]